MATKADLIEELETLKFHFDCLDDKYKSALDIIHESTGASVLYLEEVIALRVQKYKIAKDEARATRNGE